MVPRVAILCVLFLFGGALRLWAQPLPPVRVEVEPGVEPSLSADARRIASGAWAFTVRDLALSIDRPAPAVEVVFAADHAGMERAAAARGRRLSVSARAPGVTCGPIVYLDAQALTTRKGKPRSRREVQVRLAEVLAHEMTHVVAVHVGRRNIPTWFSEGLATHQSIRYLRASMLLPEAERFESRRLAPVLAMGPVGLGPISFGKEARTRFYGPEHRRCYSTGLAAVRTIEDRWGRPVLGRLLSAAGWGIPGPGRVAQRPIRWRRAAVAVLGDEVETLEQSVILWVTKIRRGQKGADPRGHDGDGDEAEVEPLHSDE